MDAFGVPLLAVWESWDPYPEGYSPMLECFRRRQIRASLSSFW